MISVASKAQQRGGGELQFKPAVWTRRGGFAVLRTATAGICLVGLALYVTGSRGAGPVPLFDAHLHYNEPAWLAFDPGYIQQMFDQNGVSGALVSSTPDDGTLTLFKADPERFVPELRPYRGDVNAGNWTRDASVVGFIEERIEKAPYAGIGEIHIYKMSDVDWEVVKQVAAIARKKNVFLHVHSESPAIERIFEIEPELTIVWAHAGFYDGSEIIGKMLSKYDRLIAEMSLRAPNILSPPGGFAPGWKELLLRHQDRIVVGTDTYINLAWAEYDELVARHRQWLDMLPRDVAEKIAHRNAERLLAK
jgi:hypothetical protein